MARRAGIGMGSLYRRYPSKELLAQRMRVMGMEQLVAQARTALAEEPDPWAAFARFLRDALSAQGAGGPLLPLVGGRLPATDEIVAAAGRLRAALDDLVDGAHRAGVLRADFASADVPLLLEHLTARIPVADERATAFHLRYLDLILAGLRTSTTDGPTALQCPAPDWAELSELWNASEG
ncbi:TetR/AcrR family transcriptional regulator [Streptomyces cellulosae]|uniref:TetR/AcrR family transcriptional regulator n=1 Tax=Streptomyces cellulosae TaxID=1968 RepID=A0ABW7YCN4_STRCE